MGGVPLVIVGLLTQPLSAEPSSAPKPATELSLDSLPPLPDKPSFALAPPNAEELARLDATVKGLLSESMTDREDAARRLLEAKPKQVPVVARRLIALAEHADKEAMKRCYESARKRLRAARKSERHGKGEAAAAERSAEEPDLLEVLIETGETQSRGWRELIEAMGLSRLLTHIGTMDAARQQVELYVRFGEFLRVDVQNQLERFGSRGVAALIEAKRHPSEKIARWADRQLDLQGKAIPSEAVRTEDFEGLADILRAYGKVRDPDAARIVISFANTERSQVRHAARQAIVMMGEVANWQLRDTFESLVGERPPRDWSWERLARELFGRFDRQRLARVYETFDSGMAALRAKDFEKAVAQFDEVLARSPRFERAAEMLPAYLGRCRELAEADSTDQALELARRAVRLAPPGPQRDSALSLELALEGRERLQAGLADQYLPRRALELDSGNALAHSTLGAARQPQPAVSLRLFRYVGASIIGLTALIALATIALRRRGAPSGPEEAPNEASSSSPDPLASEALAPPLPASDDPPEPPRTPSSPPPRT